MYLQADSNQSLVDWMNAINEGVALAVSKQDECISSCAYSVISLYTTSKLLCLEFHASNSFI